MADDLDRALLAGPRLSMISAEPDRELDAIAAAIRPSLRIASLDQLAGVLDRLAAVCAPATASPRTLDLIGHTAVSGHLQLGCSTIDAARAEVVAVFGGLAERAVLSRLGVGALRVLGCHTAAPGPAAATLDRLAELLGIEVLGASQLLYRAHYDEHGFRDAWRFLLVPARAAPVPAVLRAVQGPRALDLDALPVRPPGAGVASVRLAAAGVVRQVLALIRRDAGAHLAMAATPLCGLALASARPGAYHVADVLLDGAFLRFYPDDTGAAGVVYPVADAARLRQILDGLPELPVTD